MTAAATKLTAFALVAVVLAWGVSHVLGALVSAASVLAVG